MGRRQSCGCSGENPQTAETWRAEARGGQQAWPVWQKKWDMCGRRMSRDQESGKREGQSPRFSLNSKPKLDATLCPLNFAQKLNSSGSPEQTKPWPPHFWFTFSTLTGAYDTPETILPKKGWQWLRDHSPIVMETQKVCLLFQKKQM